MTDRRSLPSDLHGVLLVGDSTISWVGTMQSGAPGGGRGAHWGACARVRAGGGSDKRSSVDFQRPELPRPDLYDDAGLLEGRVTRPGLRPRYGRRDPLPAPVDRGGPRAPPPASDNLRRVRTWPSRGRTARPPCAGPPGARHGTSPTSLPGPGGSDVAGRSLRSTATTPRGKPRAGPRRAGPARARRRVARHIVRPRRGPHARGTRRCGSAARQGAAAPGSIPTRPSSGRAPGGRAPARNRVEGGGGGSQSLTERGRCVGGLLGVRSHDSFSGSVEPWVRDGSARRAGGPASRTLQRPRRSRRMASTRPPGTYSPSARAGRRGGGSGGVAGMVRRAGSDAPVDSSAASIRRRSRPNTAFRLRGCFDMGNPPYSITPVSRIWEDWVRQDLSTSRRAGASPP